MRKELMNAINSLPKKRSRVKIVRIEPEGGILFQIREREKIRVEGRLKRWKGLLGELGFIGRTCPYLSGGRK